MEGWSSAEVAEGGSKDGQLLFNYTSPHGYHIGERSQLVEDSRGNKLLWLLLHFQTSNPSFRG